VLVAALGVAACSSGREVSSPTSGPLPDGDAPVTPPAPSERDRASDGSTPPDDGGVAAIDPAALAADMAALSATLPEERRAAARSLVRTVRDGDPDEALVATAELLRRAGFPIVSVDGPVVALPDDVAFSDVPIAAELLGNLSASVRAGSLYPVDAVGSVLHQLETVDAPVPWPQLAVAAAEWGKDDAAPDYIVSAAAAVRALSGERGQVFAPSQVATEQGIDALALVILVGHAGAVPVPVPGAQIHGVRTAPAATGGPCDQLRKALSPADATQLEALGVAVRKWGWTTSIDMALDYNKRLAELNGVDPAGLGLATTTHGAMRAYEFTNKAASYLSIVLLLLGTTLDLDTDKTVTHYKHTDGSRDEEITATATVRFQSELAEARLACYALAGVEVPKNGPVAGINVRWSLGQDVRPAASGDLASAAHLRPTAASLAKFTIDKTDAAGTASVVVKPPVEDEPGQGAELRASVTLSAHLEKGELPFKLADLTAILELKPQAAVIGKTLDGLKSLAVDELLPTARVAIGVRYHGADPVVVKVDESVNLVLYEIPRVYADLVSCTGVAGPFTGQGGYSTVGLGDFGQWSSAGLSALGMPALPATSPAQDNALSVTPNNNGQPDRFLVAQGDGAPFVEGSLSIDPDASSTDDPLGWVTFDVGDGRQGRPVGELELLLGGSSWPFGDLTGTVYRVATDPRCPAAGSHFDAN
jgi:hypothetical protein